MRINSLAINANPGERAARLIPRLIQQA